MSDLVAQIKGYLCAGGLFNPELMPADKVRDLLRQSRDRIEALEARLAEAEKVIEPFARYASEDGFGLNHKGDLLPDADGVGWVYLTNCDFRAARAFMEKAK